MNSIEFARKAKLLRRTLDDMEQLTKEPVSSLAKYLCLLAEVYPAQLDYAQVSYELDRSPPHIGRLTRALHKLKVDGEPGMDLVEIEFDLHSPKTKLVKLNSKGHKVISRMLEQWS